MEDRLLESRCLVGIVQVDISLLTFQDDLKAKKIDPTKVQNLISIFRTSGCERDSPENQLPALISPRELDYMLETAQVTRGDLQGSLQGGGYPRFRAGDSTIYCLDGRHRLRAAEIFFKDRPEENWWTVKLATFNPSSHETKFSDGEVLRKVIYYLRRFRRDLARDWEDRLTDGRRICLSAVLARDDFTAAIEKALHFPGLSDGVKLSYWKQHLALRFDEELLNGLEHLHNTWSEMTLSNSSVRQATDIPTVRRLEKRAPSASLIDRLYIEQEMDRGTLFPTIVDTTLRQCIKEAILGIKTIIPTFRAFHENVNYLAIPAKIIQTEMIDNRITTTVRRTLYNHWSPPEHIFEEVREDEYQLATLPDGASPALYAYLQVFLGVMRHFPCRGKHSPKRERKRKRGEDTVLQEHTARACQSISFKRADRLGFRTNKIMDGLRNAGTGEMDYAEPLTESLTEDDEAVVKRRSGRPFINAYIQIRTQLFLANLFRDQTGLTANPPTLFVQRCLIEAFFGWTVVLGTTPANLTNVSAVLEDTVPDLESIINTPLHSSDSSLSMSSLPAPNTRRLGLPPGLIETWDQISRDLGIRDDNGTESERSPRSPTAAAVSDRHSLIGRDLDNERRSFPILETGASGPRPGEGLNNERQSFPMFERNAGLSDTQTSDRADERRSFPAPELEDIGTRERTTPSQARFTFVEYDGRSQEVVSTDDIERYLQDRKGWTMMVMKSQVLKTVRFDRVLEYMLRGDGEYFLLAPHFAKEFRRKYVNILRQRSLEQLR